MKKRNFFVSAEHVLRSRTGAGLLLIFSLLPVFLFSQAIESSHHLEIRDRSLVPDKTPIPVFRLDFANGAKWVKIANHQNRLGQGYGEKFGQAGFFLTGPDGDSIDTAWQVWSGKFPVRGLTSLSGTIDFYSNIPTEAPFAPFREHYVNSVYWFSADGKELGRTAFPVVIKKQGHNPVTFRFPVPDQAAEACLSLGADSPNLGRSEYLLVSDIRLEGTPEEGEDCFTDAAVVLPPVRFVPGEAVCTIKADTPEGTSIGAETAFAADKNGVPAEFTDFGPADRPVPENTGWVKCRLTFLTDGKARPALHAVTVCGKVIGNWQRLTAEKSAAIRRKSDLSDSSKQKSGKTEPVIRRLSKSPSADPNQAFVFSVMHDMPLNRQSLKVVLNGKDITADLKRAELPAELPTLESASFTYQPAEPFAMRTVYKARVTISDIYGDAFSRTMYFFFDEPLTENIVTLRDDGFILVNGKPFLPIGGCIVRPLPENGNSFDTAFEWLQKAGFNSLLCDPGMILKLGGRENFKRNMDEYLDSMARHGFKIYFPPSGNGNSKDIDAILRHVTTYYRHPSLLAWYIGDDTLSHNTPEEMELKCEAIRAVDPYHPLCQADAVFSFYPSIYAPEAAADDPSRYRPVVNFTDIFRAELYPVRDNTETNARDCVPSLIADLKTVQRDIRDKATGPRSVWGIVQYFEGWGNDAATAEWKRYPTWEELRAMSWGTLIHGAHAIHWYTYHYNPKKFAHGFVYKEETRDNIRRMTAEIAPLADVLVERTENPAPAVVILDGPEKDVLGIDSIGVMMKKHDTFTYVFALNSAYLPVKAKISIPGVSGGTVLYENDRPVLVEEGFLTDVFRQNEVHIYKLK